VKEVFAVEELFHEQFKLLTSVCNDVHVERALVYLEIALIVDRQLER
jgi:hypothetical protein